jgi:hypothetical protein
MIPALHHGECSWIYPVRAAPPGVFVLHNGMGTVAKRLNHIPTTDPMRVRILLDNPLYVSYEDTAEEVNIIGGFQRFRHRQGRQHCLLSLYRGCQRRGDRPLGRARPAHHTSRS